MSNDPILEAAIEGLKLGYKLGKQTAQPEPKSKCKCPGETVPAAEAEEVVKSGPIVPHVTSDSVTYGFDSVGRLHTLTYQNGATITYNYDTAGNRTSVVISCPSGC